MTDTELLRKIIKMVFNNIKDECDWDVAFEEIYCIVENTDYYHQLEKEREQKLKKQELNELKQKQKEEKAQKRKELIDSLTPEQRELLGV